MTIQAFKYPRRRLLPVDLNDPSLALYLPLWYPRPDMTGDTIYSYDKNRHVGTVTGATWGLQGRSFDGTDDVVNCGSASSLDALTGNQTHMAWINPAGLGENNFGTVIDKVKLGVCLSATYKIRFFLTVGAAAKTAITTDNALIPGSWACVFGIFNGANVLIDVGGTTTTGDATTGPVDSHAANDFNIGDNAASNRCFNGLIGEVISWNRALSATERTNVRLATKWRYQ